MVFRRRITWPLHLLWLGWVDYRHRNRFLQNSRLHLSVFLAESTRVEDAVHAARVAGRILGIQRKQVFRGRARTVSTTTHWDTPHHQIGPPPDPPSRNVADSSVVQMDGRQLDHFLTFCNCIYTPVGLKMQFELPMCATRLPWPPFHMLEMERGEISRAAAVPHPNWFLNEW